MACLAVGPARAGLGVTRTLAGARATTLNGGLGLRSYSWRLASCHRTLCAPLGSVNNPQRQQHETLVSISAARWLPPGSSATAVWLSQPALLPNITRPTQRSFSTTPCDRLRKTSSLPDKDDEKKIEKPSIFKRFKQMYKDYWYVLVPVHLATSAVWFGAFFYASKSGVDVAGLLESWGFSETITDKLRNSAAGHLAVAYALYKVATPARYTVTLGGTTYSIKFLSERGYIKPVPSRQEMKDMYEDRRDEFREQSREWRDKYRKQRRDWREKFQERRKHGWRKK